ncbi:PREDICTED: very long-chain acyl-CoA synthetase-like [Thamnophis sirtalis]|uniref:long-chain-fatty-acid--CoA ligase n=1 Tax=Thamnophis sirtalis TaxID=35019 RepID=A0A6I9X449_9SAUR|nr:PREDICTED: very long-chain acyl-CoA synthetase-like [Thamnophis sirtalis]
MLHFYTILLGVLILVPLLANIFLPYLWLDLCFFFSLLWSGYKSQKSLQRNPPFTFLDSFLHKVLKHPEKPFILFEDEIYSYHDIDKRSNQMARVLKDYVRLKEGETMAVFLKNIPAYIWIWMGLEKIGCTMACINYNIRLKSLLHVLKTCNAKVLLTTPDFKNAIEDVLPDLKDEGLQVFYLSDDSPSDGVEALLGQIKLSSDEPVPASYRANVTINSISLYIFTSGTTGLPKAAIINQMKLLMISNLFFLCDINAKDIIYTPLPLYHSAALLVGIGGCIDVGATCVLGSKFSVSNFWNDCRRYQVSVIQYVGETMRYLCNAPKKDNDRDHSVRLAVGNGMRKEVWKEFLCRFGCLKIYEFYGATEGNLGFINYIGKVGAIGRISYLYKKMTKFELIQYDIDQNEVVRNEKGYCVPVAPGETGLLVGKITERTPFYGYAGDYQKTRKKILQDVLEKGDRYFNSGDLMMQDHDGFIYFQDRVGDTFRWKGENVATTEVETILVMLEFIQEANVYGVSVPGHEGKIGMAAIRLKEGESFDGKQLYEHTNNYLPNYAIPHFIRIQEALDITGTFKQCKTRMVKEEFDPTVITEPLFFLDNSEKNFVPLTLEIYHSITEKKRKL